MWIIKFILFVLSIALTSGCVQHKSAEKNYSGEVVAHIPAGSTIENFYLVINMIDKEGNSSRIDSLPLIIANNFRFHIVDSTVYWYREGTSANHNIAPSLCRSQIVDDTLSKVNRIDFGNFYNQDCDCEFKGMDARILCDSVEYKIDLVKFEIVSETQRN